MPSLIAVLGLDANPFKSGLSQAQIHATRMGRSIGSAFTSQIAGFLSVAAVSALTKNTIAWASKLTDVADAQRVNVEWLQKMIAGAELYGGKLEDVEKVLDTINKQRANPTKETAAAMGRLGLGGSESLSPMAFFDKLTQRMGKGFDSQSAADLEMIGGKSARNLLLAFSEQFKNDTPVLSQELVDQLDTIGDKFTILATQLKVGIAPAIVWLGDAVVYLVNKVKQVAAFWGGAVGGGSLQAGAQARDSLKAEQDAQMKAAEDAGAKMSALRRARQGEGFSPLASGDAALKPVGKSSALELNALQKVGAFTAQSPMQQNMLTATKSIEKSAKEINAKLPAASFDSGWTRY
jgi:hypothetical protein